MVNCVQAPASPDAKEKAPVTAAADLLAQTGRIRVIMVLGRSSKDRLMST